MFNLKDFDAWDGASSLENKSILAWTKKEGYFFLTYSQAKERYSSGDPFIIKGVEK